MGGDILFSDALALQRAILAKEPKSFVSHHIFEPVPFAFENNLSIWIEWKRRLSENIDVDPQDIVMTGSAALGFSLNPFKDFRPFSAASDFDCGIVSSYYFDIAWRYLRQLRVSWLSLPRESKEAIKSHRRTYIFSGTIAADKMLGILPFGSQWQHALDMMAQIDPTKGRDVKLRIYKDYDSLRYYQAAGLEKIQIRLSGTERSEEIDAKPTGEITVEE